jgi:DNA-directed RNA polymerase
MTTKYNIEFESALSYFNNELNFIENKEEYKKIIKNFGKIFRTLKDGKIEENLFFKKSLKEFNETILNSENIYLEDIIISYTYYKLKKREICIFKDKIRYTTINYDLTNENDIRKMQTAALPHTIHALDSLYLRKIIEKMHSNNIEIFTIHDAFAIPFNKIETLIISA